MTDPQLANLIAAISAFLTLATLIYALWQGYKNSKKINDLAEITKHLAEQNILQKKMMQRDAMPDFKPDTPQTFEAEDPGYVRFPIINEGKDGRIVKIIDHSNTLELVSKIENVTIKAGNTFYVNFKTKDGISIRQVNWHIQIEYSDFYFNTYDLIIKGRGTQINDIIKLITNNYA